jgi:Co/Zn/Cd efflux system component
MPWRPAHEAVEADLAHGQTKLVDLHVWRAGRQSYSCALSVVTHDRSLTVDRIRDHLAAHEEVVHSTIEVRLHAS